MLRLGGVSTAPERAIAANLCDLKGAQLALLGNGVTAAATRPAENRSFMNHTISLRSLTIFRLPALCGGTAALAMAFCFLTSSRGIAGVNLCNVCHKRTVTVTLACNSLDYQRHLDHGDPQRACAASVTVSEPRRVTLLPGVVTTPVSAD